jgi:intergrase/recombinase
MSELDGRFVKLGAWTNLEQGKVMGRTITTDSKTGAIVIAVLAVLSTIGKRLNEASKILKVTDMDRYEPSLEPYRLCIPSVSQQRTPF